MKFETEAENQLTTNPLVSIIVITYNSSKYVLETLESAKAQIYQNIELIVSDDCSTDNTVEICRNWMELNRERFMRMKLITTQNNTGTSSNCNRGFRAAEGEWIKGIAGDDILLDNCIEQNVQFIHTFNNADIVFSKVSIMEATKHSEIFKYDFFYLKSDEQLKYLLVNGNSIPAASAFINNQFICKLGYFDERIPLIEDYPFWIKALKKKAIFGFFNNSTVRYRIHTESVSLFSLSKKYKESMYLSFKYYVFNDLIYINPLMAIDKYLVLKRRISNNTSSIILLYFLRFYSPYFYYRVFLRLVKKYK